MKPHIEEARRALRLADRDAKAFSVLAASSDVHISIVCFHAQQSVEKTLKAVLYSRNIEFRRTHNLTDLAFILREQGMDIPLSDTQLLKLNPFAVIFRYDEIDVPSLTPDEIAGWIIDMLKWADEQINVVENTEGTNCD